jgi:hypothetical protein
MATVSCGTKSVLNGGADGVVAAGTWGGENAGAVVTDTIAHIHIGCTFGDIKGRIALDANGRFTVDGSYVLRAYPVYVGPELPAQFSGVVSGKELTIAVAVNDTVQKKVVSLGPVTVKLGTDPRMGPCPICTVPGMRMRAGVATALPRTPAARASRSTSGR